jgi:L-serine/L-threonine ammonia-lyase
MHSNVYLKLENVQPSGSFKSRGIGNYMRAHLLRAAHVNKSDVNGTTPSTAHFFCSSGGNAGLAAVHAAVALDCPATIVVPMSTSGYMISKLRDAGAVEVIQEGNTWVDADQFLREEILSKAKARGEDAVYVPPFDAVDIWTGNATLVDELARQLPQLQWHYPVPATMAPDAVVCSVGGGGLLCGIMQGLEDAGWSETTKVVAVETVGADSLSQSVQSGKLTTLPDITSIATTLGARTVARRAFEYAMQGGKVLTTVLTDADAVIRGCKRFADDERILVEPSCGVALAACYTGRIRQLLPDLKPSSTVVVVVCGGSGLSLEILAKYIDQFS